MSRRRNRMPGAFDWGEIYHGVVIVASVGLMVWALVAWLNH